MQLILLVPPSLKLSTWVVIKLCIVLQWGYTFLKVFTLISAFLSFCGKDIIAPIVYLWIYWSMYYFISLSIFHWIYHYIEARSSFESVALVESVAFSTTFNWKNNEAFPTFWPTEAVVQICSVKKVFLEISQNSQENTYARVFFFFFAASGLQLY